MYVYMWMGKGGSPGSDLILKVAGDTNLNYKLHKKNKNWDGVNDEFDARYVQFQVPVSIQAKMSKRLQDTGITEQRSRLKTWVLKSSTSSRSWLKSRVNEGEDLEEQREGCGLPKGD